MLIGQVLYYYDNGTQMADIDQNVTPDYALEMSKREPHLRVEWTSYATPDDVREYRNGRRVPHARRASTAAHHAPVERPAVARGQATGRGPARGRGTPNR